MRVLLWLVVLVVLFAAAAVGGNFAGLWSLPFTLTSEHGLGVDPAVTRNSRPIRRAHDGAERVVAGARIGDRPVTEFVDNELLLTTADKGLAEKIAARYGGKVVHRVDRPAATGRPSTWHLRIDPDMAPDFTFGEKQRELRVSSARAARLLAIAAFEHEHGVSLGLNLVVRPTDLRVGVTRESNGVDAGTFDYMRPGGALDVDVIGAWRALAVAGKLGNKVRIGVIDQGYGQGNGFTDADWPTDSVLLHGNSPAADANIWHGNNVVDVLAGVPDDNQGTAGPAGPIATIIAAGKGDTICDMDESLWEIAGYGVSVINISQAATLDSGLEEAWGWAQGAHDLEDDMQFLATTGDKLIFASAGNSNANVDAVDSDGDEVTWWMPCENHGVICVNGWAPPGTTNYGKQPDGQSNFGFGKGDTVDIAGPMFVFTGNTPAAPAASPAPQPNGPPHGLTQRGGTSYSSPFVAGVAALVRAANPQLTAAQVWQILFDTSVPASPGVRRVRAYGAVQAALKMDGVNSAPFVRILTPAAGGTVPQFGKTSLVVESFDPEDGLNCCTVAWSSDKDGFMGKGFTLPFAFGGKPLGPRNLRADVADSSGAIAFAQIVVNLLNAKPELKIVKAPAGDIPQGTIQVFAVQVFDDAGLAGVPNASACASVAWRINGQPSGTGCSPTLTFKEAGPAVVTAAYTDGYGATGTTALDVNVVAGEAGAPKVSLLKPAPGDSFDFGDLTLLAVNIQDPGAGNGLPPEYEYSWTLTWLKTGQTKVMPIGKALGFKISDYFPDFHSDPGAHTFRLSLTVKNLKTGKSSNTASVDIVLNGTIH